MHDRYAMRIGASFHQRGVRLNPFVIKVRSLARKAGLIGVINRFRPAGPYEQRVTEALASAVKPGDVVWDIGANVGLYSEIFCKQVGKEGRVISFEPLEESCDQIRKRLPDCEWLQVENIALGDTDASGMLMTGESSVENHLATGTELQKGSANAVPVTVCRGDTICEQMGGVPNVVKLDVEGFEEEVLKGMDHMLASPVLRSILVEVHFMKLEKRGQATAPARIERLLGKKGFKTRWVDASHLFATR